MLNDDVDKLHIKINRLVGIEYPFLSLGSSALGGQ